jgi:hypothetical protein
MPESATSLTMPQHHGDPHPPISGAQGEMDIRQSADSGVPPIGKHGDYSAEKLRGDERPSQYGSKECPT